MFQDHEYLYARMNNGLIYEGYAMLFGRNRISDVFNEKSFRFVTFDENCNTSDANIDHAYVNKDLILCAAPRDVRHSQKNYIYHTREYNDISIRTVDNLVINGKVNLQVYSNIFDFLNYTAEAPFLVLINAKDTNGESYHTLLLNKSFIIKIESHSS